MKSAQLPLHGWLTEVMEAPTPVSAFLHAGIINAGGFLLVRFADLFILTPLTLALLAILGGLSALFASVVMLTQSSVKTSLAWSTISQMGFMVLQCGLGLFSLAMLHIVAHSLYKAHAFLASGEAVERIASIRRPGPIAVPDMAAVAKAFLLASGIYIAVGAAFGLTGKPPQAIALGLILIFGVAYLLAQGLADAAPRQLTVRTAFYSLAVALGYFTLHSIAEKFYGGLLPQPLPVGDLETAVIILALISFGTVALAQAALPLWAGHPAVTGLRVHLSNGFYLSAVFNRLMGGWTLARDAR
jgi:NAD(P)H-quinone oxidoreductase subunit 5